MTYDDVLYGTIISKDLAATYRTTWPNGNDPDGEMTVEIYVVGGEDADGHVGYILQTDDGECGTTDYDASETVYDSESDAIAAAVAYAIAHHESDVAEFRNPAEEE